MSTVRSILKEHHIHPYKRLGQSFLEDKNIINKIIAAANIHDQDIVVEIGAGLGILTAGLAAKARKVFAIDVDPRMAAILRERLREQRNVEIIEKDILTCEFSTFLSATEPGKLKVIGNIPYNISTQILINLIKYRRYIASMLLLFQREVADRIIALPGTKEYGIPTVIVGMYAVAKREMNVPASCFYPPPQVTSSLLQIAVREKPLVALADDAFFHRIVKMAFSHRRKVLLNNLRVLLNEGYAEEELVLLLNGLGIEGRRRGETLSPGEFGILSNALFNLKRKELPIKILE